MAACLASCALIAVRYRPIAASHNPHDRCAEVPTGALGE